MKHLASRHHSAAPPWSAASALSPTSEASPPPPPFPQSAAFPQSPPCSRTTPNSRTHFFVSQIRRATTAAVLLLLLLLPSCRNPQFPPLTRGELLPINGTELFVRTVGQGDPVIVVHGGPVLEHGYLYKHLEPLAESVHLIFYDQRLSGRSSADVDSNDITMKNFVEDIEAIRQHFRLGRIHLMGHSWGGMIAMYYAIEYGENLQSLILLNSMPASWEVWQEENKRLASMADPADAEARNAVVSSDAYARKEVSAFEELYRISFRGQFYDRTLVDSLSFYIAPDLDERGRKFGALMPELINFDIHDDLSSVLAPTLIVYGAAEAAATLSGQRLRLAIPNSKLIIIPNSGHFPFVETPGAFLTTVASFLKKNEL